MNTQLLSFTYNFDTSHLNNGNSNDNGKNDRTIIPSSPSLSNPNYFSLLQNNNYSNTSLTLPTSLSTSSPLNNLLNDISGFNGINGFGNDGELAEETEELKKMNLNHFKNLIPAGEIPTQLNKNKETNHDDDDDDFNYDQKEPVLQNVISAFNLDCKLDLPKIQKKARNTEYHPKRFAALVMRIKSPQTTALIFSSGKVVVTGAKNESQSKLACKKFARIIKKLDFPATFKDFKVHNILASCEVGYKVSLENLVTSEHGKSCRFEPELFPGLIYKMIEPKVTLLIFVSGKIVNF